MANKEVPELTAASTLDGTEIVHVIQGGNSRRTTTGDSAALAVVDEDDFASNSATKAPSQQSAKAYIDGKAKIQLQPVVATTSGTSINVASIPPGVKSITIGLSELSTSGGSAPILQIGDSGGVESSGYLGSILSVNAGSGAGTSIITSGLSLDRSGSATTRLNGLVTLKLLDASTNKWSMVATTADSAAAFVNSSASSKALSAELDRVRLTTAGGTDTFDSGSMSVAWEF